MTRASSTRWILLLAFAGVTFASYSLFVRPKVAVARVAESVYRDGSGREDRKDLDGAIRRYDRVLEEYPSTPIAPKAAFALGQIYMRKTQEFEKAKNTFRFLAKRYPTSEFAPRANENLFFLDAHRDHNGAPLRLWFQASEAHKAEHFGEAARLLTELVSNYPDATIRPTAYFRLGEAQAKALDFESARQTYQDFIAAYPDDTNVAEARRRLEPGSLLKGLGGRPGL